MNRAATDQAARLGGGATTGMQRFFHWMEQRYGGSLPMDTGEAGQIITRSALRGDDLQRLFRHEATALHVPGFYHPASAAAIGRELSDEVVASSSSASTTSSRTATGQPKLRNWKVSTSRGLESSDVSTLGEHPPYNVVASASASSSSSRDAASTAASSASAHDAYFDGVLREFRSRRQPRRRRRSDSNSETNNDNNDGDGDNSDELLSPPRLWPLDFLRLELDERWPGGAGLAREKAPQSRPYGGGLPRVMVGPTRWRRGFIHVDEMGPLDPVGGLFSANIYLQLPDPDPDQGGKSSSEVGQKQNADSPRLLNAPQPVLHVWPLGIRSRWDWYRNAVLLSGMSSQDPEAQMRLWKELGTPQTVAVAPGDLVVLCVQRPHCAIGFQSGIRVSLQCFLQHQGSKERLLVDC
jgi:hypothetical protein